MVLEGLSEVATKNGTVGRATRLVLGTAMCRKEPFGGVCSAGASLTTIHELLVSDR